VLDDVERTNLDQYLVIDNHSRIHVPDMRKLHNLEYSDAYEPGTMKPPSGPKDGAKVYFYGHAVSNNMLGCSKFCLISWLACCDPSLQNMDGLDWTRCVLKRFTHHKNSNTYYNNPTTEIPPSKRGEKMPNYSQIGETHM
jgi:hypothetical protein